MATGRGEGGSRAGDEALLVASRALTVLHVRRGQLQQGVAVDVPLGGAWESWEGSISISIRGVLGPSGVQWLLRGLGFAGVCLLVESLRMSKMRTKGSPHARASW